MTGGKESHSCQTFAARRRGWRSQTIFRLRSHRRSGTWRSDSIRVLSSFPLPVVLWNVGPSSRPTPTRRYWRNDCTQGARLVVPIPAPPIHHARIGRSLTEPQKYPTPPPNHRRPSLDHVQPLCICKETKEQHVNCRKNSVLMGAMQSRTEMLHSRSKSQSIPISIKKIWIIFPKNEKMKNYPVHDAKLW